MCGIARQFNFDRDPIDRNVIRRMTESIPHRGSDDEG
jgi:asparagine synthetase B (glutamine-hydrolysing)